MLDIMNNKDKIFCGFGKIFLENRAFAVEKKNVKKGPRPDELFLTVVHDGLNEGRNNHRR